MANLARRGPEEDFFLIAFEPTQARFAQERTKTPSEDRFERSYGTKKNYQKPAYEVSTYAELRGAIRNIIEEGFNHDMYSTSNGLYRERMRVAQSLRDRNLSVSPNIILSADPAQLDRILNQDRKKPFQTQRQPGWSRLN